MERPGGSEEEIQPTSIKPPIDTVARARICGLGCTYKTSTQNRTSPLPPSTHSMRHECLQLVSLESPEILPTPRQRARRCHTVSERPKLVPFCFVFFLCLSVSTFKTPVGIFINVSLRCIWFVRLVMLCLVVVVVVAVVVAVALFSFICLKPSESFVHCSTVVVVVVVCLPSFFDGSVSYRLTFGFLFFPGRPLSVAGRVRPLLVQEEFGRYGLSIAPSLNAALLQILF